MLAPAMLLANVLVTSDVKKDGVYVVRPIPYMIVTSLAPSCYMGRESKGLSRVTPSALYGFEK